MSLVKTLAKVAIGVAAAKGIGAVVKNQQANQRNSGGSGSVFGGAYSNATEAQRRNANTQGGLEDLLGGLMGGQRSTSGSAQGGLGGLLDSLGGAQTRGGSQNGGLDQVLGGLAKQLGGAGGTGAAGGLGGLLGALTGGAASQQGNNVSFGEMFNQSARNQGEPDISPSADQEAAAALMLRAMIQAMKADGDIDQAEQARLTERLSDTSAEELAFVREQLQAPMDVQGLIRDVPRGLEQHVYLMSVMAIDLDNQKEAQYLDQLGRGMGLEPQVMNQIHAQLGVPELYA